MPPSVPPEYVQSPIPIEHFDSITAYRVTRVEDDINYLREKKADRTEVTAVLEAVKDLKISIRQWSIGLVSGGVVIAGSIIAGIITLIPHG
jgi:hypothetical protein